MLANTEARKQAWKCEEARRCEKIKLRGKQLHKDISRKNAIQKQLQLRNVEYQ